MAREVNNIASALFDKIRTRFDNVNLGDEKAKSTTDPENARYINFDYVSNGVKFGNITISLIDENSLKVYFLKDIISKLDPEQQKEWFGFLRGLRQFAKRNLLMFDTRDITKSNLQLKDVKQQSKSDSVMDTDDVTVSEGLDWNSLSEELSVEEKITIIEEFCIKGNLTESVDEDKKDYFASLCNLSDAPIKNQKYIVVPLSLVANRVMILAKPGYMEFLGKGRDGLVFRCAAGQKTYPPKIMRDMSITNTFTFSTTGAYNKFRTALSIKFDTDLPDITLVNESRMHGTSRSSYEDCGPVRIIVRHSDNIDEEQRGARSRKIESVFVETHLGERFLLKSKNLHGARAMARHVSEGGRIDDELGCGISEMCEEMSRMSHFVRAAKRRQFEDAETGDMANAAVQHYMELKKKLQHIGGHRGYNDYKDTYIPEAAVEEEIDVAALRERFVKKVYDERFDEALPYVERAYRRQKALQETPMAEEFEAWAEDVTNEGTWAIPDTSDEIEELDKEMVTPIPAGPNGENAIAIMSKIIGDDDLNDQFTQAAEQDPETDVRPIIIQWLTQANPELAAKYTTQYQQPGTPEQPETPNQTTGATGMDQPYPNGPMPPQQAARSESTDPLDFIRYLSGLKRQK